MIHHARVSAAAALLSAGAVGVLGQVASVDVPPPDSRAVHERPIVLDSLDVLRVTTGGRVLPGGGPAMPESGCTFEASHTDASFTGGSYTLQAGFGEGEMFAATYVLAPSDFPIRIDQIDFILATLNASVQTVTAWSVLVWDGPPNTGILMYEFSSDDLILPHARIGPGTAGLNVRLVVDPGDPEQIFLFNDSGTSRFTIALRIDEHNLQTQDPCVQAPPQTFNAFPVTDRSGLAAPAGNWLFGLNCGFLGCPPNGGWATFQQLNFLCRPSGDIVMKANWTRVNCQPGVGACCKPDGSCEPMLVADCAAINGVYQGDGVSCGSVQCPAPIGACCTSTGGCVSGVTEAICSAFQGTFAGGGTDCTDHNGNGTADICETTPVCRADLSGSSDPMHPDYGVPDGQVDASDFFYFLDQFTEGNFLVADMSGSSDPTSPDYGVPDGLLDASDFFYFLDVFVLGCG
ncbi:MAG: hypothetical protein KF866_05835 [Phycisphaeraceae bacterium]|nr:hypothetical protein [Phycisphaeraceae bacterium]MCW5754515.1 hypothetical protein [Phycisphaeraceae bacterium]